MAMSPAALNATCVEAALGVSDVVWFFLSRFWTRVAPAQKIRSYSQRVASELQRIAHESQRVLLSEEAIGRRVTTSGQRRTHRLQCRSGGDR